MSNLFFSPKALLVRLVALLVALAISIVLTTLFPFSTPYSFFSAVVLGIVSQVGATFVLARDYI